MSLLIFGFTFEVSHFDEYNFSASFFVNFVPFCG